MLAMLVMLVLPKVLQTKLLEKQTLLLSLLQILLTAVVEAEQLLQHSKVELVQLVAVVTVGQAITLLQTLALQVLVAVVEQVLTQVTQQQVHILQAAEEQDK